MGQTSSANRPQSEFGFSPDGTFGAGGQARKKFKHPVAAFFHVFFKLSALIAYLFGGLVGEDFLGLFVSLVFLITFDFWTVKNVTGRLLVGLRWWNYIDEEGESHWVFENRLKRVQAQQQQQTQSQSCETEFVLFSSDRDNGQSASSPGDVKGLDKTLFWSAIILSPIFWLLFLFSAFFSLNVHWVLFDLMALVLSGMNLYAYMQCRFGAGYNYRNMLTSYVGPQMIFNLMKNSRSDAEKGAPEAGSNVPPSSSNSALLYGQLA